MMSSGKTPGIFWSSWTVVWREWPRRGQELNFSWRGRVSDWLSGHLCWSSRQLPHPTSWLCEASSVECSDLQRPLLSGLRHWNQNPPRRSFLHLCPHTPFYPSVFWRCLFRHRVLQTSWYPSAETSILMLLWYWGGLTARGRCLSSTNLY